MNRYVKDFSDTKQVEKQKKRSGVAKFFIFVFILLGALLIFVFPHEKYVKYTAYGKEVVAINSITRIGYYLEFSFETELVEGKTQGKYKMIDKDVLIFSKEKILGVEVYYNELKDVMFDTSDIKEDDEMTIFQIFFKSIFGA